MKITNKFLALALVAVTMVFASCSKDDNDTVGPTQQEIETKIIGKWKKMKQDGKDVATNQRTIWLFNNDGKGTLSVADYKEGDDRFIWDNKESVQYSVQGNVVYIISPSVERTSTIPSISDSQMTMHVTKVLSHAIGIKADYVGEYSKVTADYSKDIIGLWEGVEMTGYETYGNAEARIEYRADGTYTYYKKEGDYWVPSSNVDNEYNVDGDWLATRWRPDAGADYNYEWWDIDYIKDGTMKWSALREKEDGTRFTTTFTWKKVEMPTQQEIETKILGRWKNVNVDGVTVLTNDRNITYYGDDKTGTSSVSRLNDHLGVYDWEIKKTFTWSVEKNTISQKSIAIGIMQFMSVTDIDGHHISYIITKAIDPQGFEHKLNLSFVVQKVTADYSNDIIGMWEGVEMTGYETYGNIEARIEYKADGTYTYYKKVDGEWQPLADVIDEYNVDGDWLATRWQNNGSDVMNYEWWDIDYIKDGIMKWSALREKEDGTRFTTTFTWKKVK